MNKEKVSEKYRIVAEEIQKMAKRDQEMRHKLRHDNDAWDEAIDRENTTRMKEIIDEIGWPTVSKVGDENSSNAWLLVQHADHDVQFQKKCLELIKGAPENEVSKRDIAYLEDRVAIGEGRPQIYGTQFQKIDGEMQPLPIIDSDKVEARRREMGLEPLEENRKRLQKSYNS